MSTPTAAVTADTTDIDLTKISHIDNAMADSSTVLVSTVADGWPDIAMKGSFAVWDKDHVFWWERGHGMSERAANQKSKFAAFYNNAAVRGSALRIFGEVVEVVTEGPKFEEVYAKTNPVEQGRDADKKGCGVIARVDLVRSGPNAMQLRGHTA